MKSISSPSNDKSSRSSPSLDYARRTQTEAMESRTARRVDELLEGGSAFGRKGQTSVISPSVARSMRGSPLLDAVRQTHHEALAHRTTKRIEDLREEVLTRVSPPHYDEAVRLPTVSPRGTPALIANSMKRNITQRRSRGRVSDDGSTAPTSLLLSRRPRSRSKDRRYSLESKTINDDFAIDGWQDGDLPRAALHQSPPLPARSRASLAPDPSHIQMRMDPEVRIHDSSHERVRSDETSASPRPLLTMDSSMQTYAPMIKRSIRSSFDDRRSQAGSEHFQSDSGEESESGKRDDDGESEPSKRDDGPVAEQYSERDRDGSIAQRDDGYIAQRDDGYIAGGGVDDHRGVFSKKFIPDRTNFPDLHDTLSKLWDHRQSVFTAMNLSLNDDDMHHYEIYKALFASTNLEMYSALREGLGISSEEIANCERQEWRAASIYSSNTVRPSRISHTLPSVSNLATPLAAPEAIVGAETRWRGVDSMLLSDSLPGRSLKQSYKETEHTFEILFSYQAVMTPRVVNENLPTRILYSMARGYLENDFGFQLSGDHDLKLEFDDRLITHLGVLGDVPILPGAIIMVRYPIKPPISGESPGTPSTKLGISFSGENQSVNHAESRVDQMQSQQPFPSRSPPARDGDDLYDTVAFQSLDPRSYDKIRQNFKCPKFSGQARDWKIWDKGFWRYLSIWELEYVLDPSFFDVIPLTPDKRRDNKLVYFIIEDAVQGSTLATSYIKQAPIGNGFEAYYVLHDGYVFAGSTTATLLLNELSHFRFLADETPTELCLRLDELFQELKDLPADASVTFNDTQKVGYLVNALRHEKEWDYVCSAITSAQIKGGYTFHEACNELKFRCEASRANELMDKPVKGRRVKGLVSKSTNGGDQDTDVEELATSVMGLISSMSKKLNGDKGTDKNGRRPRPVHPCLAAGCEEQTPFPLCPLHYHPLISGKSTSVKLKNNYGDATFDSSSQFVKYPSKVPENRLTTKQIADRKSGNQTSAKVVTIETPSTSVSAKVAGTKQ